MGRLKNILKGKDKNPEEKEEIINPDDDSDVDNPELDPEGKENADNAHTQDPPPDDDSGKSETSEDIPDNKFYLGNKRKHYVIDENYCKRKKAEQIIKNGKMVYSDTGIECSYYLNLTPDEEKRYRENGKIF